MKSKATSLYIHIPFCNSICTYCDFSKFIYNQERVNKYFESLFFDLNKLEKKHYKTIYIGGGTPSSIDHTNLSRLLSTCKELLVDDYKEFTIESNVEDQNEEFLTLLKENKVNRLSIGVQTFNEKYIKLFNRHHTKEQAINNIALASSFIDNVSIDMIYALPNQTLEELKEDLKVVSNLVIKHISYYSLLIEKNTVLWAKGYKDMGDEKQNIMYRLIKRTLKGIGFNRYEISNFSRGKKYESYHNKVYWHNQEYDAIGIAASGYDGKYRYRNITNILKYINGDRTLDYQEEIDKKEKMFEEIMLRLRLDEGLNVDDFNKKFNCDFFDLYKNAIRRSKDEKLIRSNKKNIKATLKGSLVLNSVLELFLEDNDDIVIVI